MNLMMMSSRWKNLKKRIQQQQLKIPLLSSAPANSSLAENPFKKFSCPYGGLAHRSCLKRNRSCWRIAFLPSSFCSPIILEVHTREPLRQPQLNSRQSLLLFHFFDQTRSSLFPGFISSLFCFSIIILEYPRIYAYPLCTLLGI